MKLYVYTPGQCGDISEYRLFLTQSEASVWLHQELERYAGVALTNEDELRDLLLDQQIPLVVQPQLVGFNITPSHRDWKAVYDLISGILKTTKEPKNKSRAAKALDKLWLAETTNLFLVDLREEIINVIEELAEETGVSIDDYAASTNFAEGEYEEHLKAGAIHARAYHIIHALDRVKVAAYVVYSKHLQTGVKAEVYRDLASLDSVQNWVFMKGKLDEYRYAVYEQMPDGSLVHISTMGNVE